MKLPALTVAAAALTFVQSFEVASIRPANPDGHTGIHSEKGRFQAHATLKRLIAHAYGVDPREIFGGPTWINSDGFDINAKIPDEFVPRQQELLPLILQNLLSDRFQLVIHRESRESSGYALVLTKKGPKMEPAKADPKRSGFYSSDTHLSAENATMDGFAKHLSNMQDLGRAVVDKTGLNGRFDFQLDWSPVRRILKPEPSPDDPPSIFVALETQLGLKLELIKVPYSAIVVDRAAQPEQN